MAEQKKQLDMQKLVLSKVKQKDIRVLKELNAQIRHLEGKLDAVEKEYSKKINAINKEYQKVLKKLNLDESSLGEDDTKLLGIIQKELDTGIDMVPEEVVLELAKKEGFSKQKTINLFDNLEFHGELYKPRRGFLKTPSKNPEVN